MSSRRVTPISIPGAGLGAIIGNSLHKKDHHADPLAMEFVSVEDLVKSVKNCEEQLNSCIKQAETTKKTRRARSPVAIKERPPWGFHTPSRDKSPIAKATPRTTVKPGVPPFSPPVATSEGSAKSSRATTPRGKVADPKPAEPDQQLLLRVASLEKTVEDQAAIITELRNLFIGLTQKQESLETTQKASSIETDGRIATLNSHMQFFMHNAQPHHQFVDEGYDQTEVVVQPSSADSTARKLNLSGDSSSRMQKIPPSPPMALHQD